MNGVLFLTAAHLRAHRGRTAILVLCTALALALPVVGALLVQRYERDLSARARSTPMVLGAKGNRFDLVLGALYFRAAKLDQITQGTLDEVASAGTVIPLHLGCSARQRPVVGTSPEYYELRGLRAAHGTLPLLLGDACLGSDVARDLDLAPGAVLPSDPRNLYDIAAPAVVRLRVCGVLARTGTADDGAVFVDVKTGWVLQGLAHGHARPDPERSKDQVLKASDGHVVFSEAMIEHHEVTADNVADFHFHGDPARRPLSAALFVPGSDRAATMTKAKVNLGADAQLLVPREVVGELLAFVFRLKTLFDVLALVLGTITAALVALVLLLSARLRQREMLTLHRLGCSPRTVWLLHGCELAGILFLGMLLAALLVALALSAVPAFGTFVLGS